MFPMINGHRRPTRSTYMMQKASPMRANTLLIDCSINVRDAVKPRSVEREIRYEHTFKVGRQRKEDTDC